MWQRRDSRRGSYPEAPRPDEGYRRRPGNGFAQPGRDEYAPAPDGYPPRRDDGYQSHRGDGYPPRRDGHPGWASDGRGAYDRGAYDPGAYDGPGYDRGAYNNRAYDNRGYDNRGYDNRGYDDRGYDDRGYDDRGYDDRAYDNRAYDNRGYDNRAYDRPPAGDRVAHDPGAHDRPGYDRPGYDRPGYDHGAHDNRAYEHRAHDNRAYDGPAYDRPAADRTAPSSQRPGTNALEPPGSWPEPEAAGYERSAESKADLVPVQNQVTKRAEYQPADPDDDTLTSPLPVILPGATAVPRPATVEATRGPFEPALPSDSPGRPVSVTGSVEPPPIDFQPAVPPPPRPIAAAAATKLDQLKDLYFTAEAIGEDALGKHFDQVSQRQHELISDFFKQSEPGDAGRGSPQA